MVEAAVIHQLATFGWRQAMRVSARALGREMGQPRSSRSGGARQMLDARRDARLT